MDTNHLLTFGTQGKREPHVAVLIQAIRDNRLTLRHWRVLAALIGLAAPGQDWITVARPALAKAAGLAVSTAGKTVAELVAFGYLVTEKRRVNASFNPVTCYALRGLPAEVHQ
jgi:DNA-binding MarR family transcriptional regulator